MNAIICFLKRWTLPVAIAIGAIVYLLFAYTPRLEQASSFFAPIMNAILPMFMFLNFRIACCRGNIGFFFRR